MTPAQWKRLAVAISERLVVCGPAPGMVARNVLLALVYRLAGGGAPRSQAELAQELGLGDRAMRGGIDELCSLGLVWLVRDPEDARRRLPMVNTAQVRAWASGEFVPVDSDCDGSDTEIPAEKARFFAVDSKADALQNSTHPRARGNSSSSSHTRSSSAPPAPTDASESFEIHHAMVSAVRKALPFLPPGAREIIWNWVGVYPVGLVQDACRVTIRKGGRSLDYIESVLSSMQAAAVLPDDEEN